MNKVANLAQAMNVLGLLVKARRRGPYIGPKGGKWSDPHHKHHWDPNQLDLFGNKPAPTHAPAKPVVEHAPAVAAEVPEGTRWRDLGHEAHFERLAQNGKLTPAERQAALTAYSGGRTALQAVTGAMAEMRDIGLPEAQHKIEARGKALAELSAASSGQSISSRAVDVYAAANEHPDGDILSVEQRNQLVAETREKKIPSNQIGQFVHERIGALSAAEQKQREDAARASAEAAKLKEAGLQKIRADVEWKARRDAEVTKKKLLGEHADAVSGGNAMLQHLYAKKLAALGVEVDAGPFVPPSDEEQEARRVEIERFDASRKKAAETRKRNAETAERIASEKREAAAQAARVAAIAANKEAAKAVEEAKFRGQLTDHERAQLSDRERAQLAAVRLENWTPTEQYVKAKLAKRNIDGRDHHELAVLAVDVVQSVREAVSRMFAWKDKETTKSAVKVLIRDKLWAGMPGSYDEAEIEKLADSLYDDVYNDAVPGLFSTALPVEPAAPVVPNEPAVADALHVARDAFVDGVVAEFSADPELAREVVSGELSDLLPHAVAAKLAKTGQALDADDLVTRILERLRESVSEPDEPAMPVVDDGVLSAAEQQQREDAARASAEARTRVMDPVSAVVDKLAADSDVRNMALVNSREDFRLGVKKDAESAVLDMADDHGSYVEAIYRTPEQVNAFYDRLADQIYDAIRAEESQPTQSIEPREAMVNRLAVTGKWLLPTLLRHEAEFAGEAAQTIKTRLRESLDGMNFTGDRTELAQSIFERMKLNAAAVAVPEPMPEPVVPAAPGPEPVVPETLPETEPAIPEAVIPEPTEPVEPEATREPIVEPDDGPELSERELAEQAAEELRRVADESPEQIVQGKRRIAANAAAVKAANLAKREGRPITEDEYDIIKAYTGEGGIGASLNQYFTRRDLVVTVWEMLKQLFMGDKMLLSAGARVLEPACGAGAFIGGAPDGVKVTGVEIDANPAVVASVLYPKHEVRHDSFESYTISQTNKGPQFDAVIGNAPFITRTGNVARLHKPEEKNADRYFLDTSLDHTKDGGVVAMIVHKSVLDSNAARDFRSKLLARAELVDAYRLPRETFKHAGTEVVSDLILLRKRPADEAAMLTQLHRDGRLASVAGALGDASAQAMVEGRFFDAHPDRVLGRTETVMGRFGPAETVFGDADALPKQLRMLSDKPVNAGSHMLRRDMVQQYAEGLPEGSQESNAIQAALNAEPARPPKVPTEGDVDEFGVGSARGRYVYLDGQWQSISDSEAVQTVIERTASAAMREAVALAQDISDMLKTRDGWTEQLDTGPVMDPDDELEARARRGAQKVHAPDVMRARGLRRELQARVQNWVNANGIPMEHKALVKLSRVVPVISKLLGAVGDAGQLSDALRKDPVVAVAPDETVDRASLAAVIKHIAVRDGELDPDQVAEFWTGSEGMSREQVRAALLASPDVMVETDGSLGADLRFGRLRHREDYVTGKVYQKLDAVQKEAESAKARGDAAMVEKLAQQEEALQGVIATRHRPIESVNLSLDQRWLPLSVVSAFLSSDEGKEQWGATGTKAWEKRAEGSGTYGIESFNLFEEDGVVHAKVKLARAAEPVEMMTSKTAHTLMKYINGMSGLKREQMEQIDRVNAAFNDWLRSSDHAKDIERLYNRSFFGEATRRFSTAPLDIKGMNPKMTLHGYQNAAVRWGYETGRGLLGDGTGVGKTFTLIALYKMMRDAGRMRRGLIAVPKSVVTNWEKEIELLFPGSRVMVIGEHKVTDPKTGEQTSRTDSPEERDAKLAAIRQNDYDFILITKPALHKIKMSQETLERYQNDPENRHAFETIRDAAVKDGGDRTKAQEKAVARGLARDQARAADKEFRTQSGSSYFDDLGVDAIYMDEAHSAKNLFKARDRFGATPKYMGAGAESKSSHDLLMKTDYLREQAAKKGQKGMVFLATATPTKNSPLELFNLLEQIAPDEWADLGIKGPEDFISRYLKIAVQPALSISGKKAKKSNDDEDPDDVEDDTPDDLNDPKGEIIDTPCVVGFQHLLELKDLLDKFLMARTAQEVNLKQPDSVYREVMVPMLPEQHILYHEIQQRYQENAAADEPDPAVLLTALTDMFQVSQDLHIYNTTQAKRKDGKDLGFTRADGMRSPKYVKCVDQIVQNIKDGKGGQVVFAEQILVHGMIREMLIARGIKPSEIGVINATEAPNSGIRQAIGDAFNKGELKVVIGNTGTMGEGVNLQGKNHALGTTDTHHIDLPWDPGSKTQRDGRARRQGNPASTVTIWEYLSEGSADGYRAVSLRGKESALATLTSGVDEVANEADQSAQIQQLMDMARYASDPAAGKAHAEKRQKYIEEKYAMKCAARDIEKFHTLQRDKESFRRMTDPDRKASLGARIRAAIEQLRTSALPEHIVAALDDPKAVAVGPKGGVMQIGRVYEDHGTKYIVDKIDPGQRQVLLRRFGDKLSVPVTRSYDDIPAQSSMAVKHGLTPKNELLYFAQNSGLSSNTMTVESVGKKRWDRKQMIAPGVQRMFSTATKDDQQAALRILIARGSSSHDKVLVRLPETPALPARMALLSRNQLLGPAHERAKLMEEIEKTRAATSHEGDYWDLATKKNEKKLAELPPDGPSGYDDAEIILPWDKAAWKEAKGVYAIRNSLRDARGGTFGLYDYSGEYT